jgi:[acyl-carrier-protein] S-malonyltransferase
MAGLMILCSGQGRQEAAMLDGLRGYPEARAVEDELLAGGVLASGYDDASRMYQNDVAQPLICLYQAMVWAVVQPRLPAPELFAGYSLGELSAYGCAGALAPADVLRLAQARGRLMQAAARAGDGAGQAMIAVLGARQQELAGMASRFAAWPAIINGPDHVIYGLPAKETENFIEAAIGAGATRTVRLPVTAAAHTPYMASAASAFEELLRQVACRPVTAAVLSGVSGQRVFVREQMVAALTRQIRQTIDWQVCMEVAHGHPCRVFLELGPGSSLVNMLRAAFPDVEARSVAEFKDVTAVGKWVETAWRRQEA